MLDIFRRIKLLSLETEEANNILMEYYEGEIPYSYHLIDQLEGECYSGSKAISRIVRAILAP